MLNRDQLADLLNQVNVKKLAVIADVSEKTIYRLRHKRNPPNMGTVQKLIDAVKAMEQPAKRRAAKTAASPALAAVEGS